MTIRSVKEHPFRACMQWALLTASLLLSFAAQAQDVANKTTFKFAKISDIGAIGSLSADSANDIWATAVLKPVALHFDGNRIVGHLEIPRLRISVDVLEGSGESTLSVAAGHIEGTSLPGMSGNMGI